jgi:hypothetical protein
MKKLLFLFCLLSFTIGCSPSVPNEKIALQLNNYVGNDKLISWEIADKQTGDGYIRYTIKLVIECTNYTFGIHRLGTHEYMVGLLYKKFGSEYIFDSTTDNKFVQ